MTTAEEAINAAARASRFKVTHAGSHGGHELMRVHALPTPAEKKWVKAVDAVILVHPDFERLGFDAAGFFIVPADFHAGGTPPKNAQAVQELDGIGPALRVSWKPPHLHNSRELAAYIEAAYERLWVEE